MSQLEDLLQQCTVKIIVPGGWGTGFFAAPGLILTCAHVVQRSPKQIPVEWQNQPLDAVIERSLPDSYDLALLRVTLPAEVNPPCVWLDEEVRSRDPLYLFGYPDEGDRQGEPRTFNCDGTTGSDIASILFNLGQVRPGMSGSPLLNQRTGKVCGMVKFTRDRSSDLGGGAIPTRVILEQFPELRELQREFHESDRRWVNLITAQSGIDVQPYLNSVVATYEKWWQYYTLTDAEGKQRQKQEEAPIFDFGLMVQTVTKQVQEQEKEQEEEKKEKQEKEKVERFSVLEGLRKYALGEKPEPVLLVGRPGSGKSTALARLMLEEATQTSEMSQKSEFFKNSDFSARSPQIPILVELRYWQGSIAQLIVNALKRHGLAVASDQLETVLNQSLLLFDGVNELPSEEARTQLSAFRRDHPKVPMIFTTRDLSFGGDLGIERKLEMQPLTETQMKAFIRAYVPEQAEAMLRQLKDRLREFGQTPLLLWMLCEVFQQAPSNQLPSNLGGVFQAFTQMYEESSVRKHEVALLKGDVRPLSDRRLWKKAMMAIAAIMMQGKTSVDFRRVIHRDEAERELSRVFPNEKFPVRDILDDLLKYHLLQNRTTDQIEFRHQLLQEYYAAEWLLARLEGLDNLTLQREYLNYLKWTEPLALTLALVTDEALAVRVVEQSLAVDLGLGARLAGEVKSDFQEITIKIIRKLALLEHLKILLLCQVRCENIIPILAPYISDRSFEIRYNVAHALGTICSTRVVDELLKLLEECDYSTWLAIVMTLIKTPNQRVINRLINFLDHPSPDYRRTSIFVLGEIGSKESVEKLLGKIKDPDNSVSQEAISALAKIKTDTAVTELINAFEEINANHSLYSCLLYALKMIGRSEKVADALSYALSKPKDYDSIYKLIEVLGEVGSEEHVSKLSDYLYWPDFLMQLSAAEAIREIGGNSTMNLLTKELESKNFYVRWSMAVALSKTDNKPNTSVLIDALTEKDVFIQSRAIEALGRIGDETVVPLLSELINNNDTDWLIRCHVISALREIGDQSAIDTLIHALDSNKEDVCKHSVWALGEMRCRSAVAKLHDMLQEDLDLDVRRSVIEALGDIGDQEVVDTLVSALKDAKETDVRRVAAEALGKLRSEQAVPSLLNALQDNEDVRRSAAVSLGKLGSPKILTALWQDQLKASDMHTYSAISAIQNRCKFYNYEIWQEAIQHPEQAPLIGRSTSSPTDLLAKIDQTTQKIDRRTQQMANEPKNDLRGATFNAPVNLGDNPTGDFISTQNNYTTYPEVQGAISDLRILLTQIQAQHPQVRTESEALSIIDAEFTDIKQSPTSKLTLLRQQLLNPERHTQALKATLGEVAKHFLEDSIWAKAILTYLDTMSESPDQGA